ncbi:MAG: hypothetical protein KDA65_08065 [Planctomycetaceae bacterium]|nr:hypothetical protein [Planctomycetaceae bacterium]
MTSTLFRKNHNRLLFLGSLLLTSLCGCSSEYSAVDEVGYPTVWFVTVQLEDGSEQDVILEELKTFAEEHSTTKGVRGFNRQSGEKVLIPLEKVLQPDPQSLLVVERHQEPQ